MVIKIIIRFFPRASSNFGNSSMRVLNNIRCAYFIIVLNGTTLVHVASGHHLLTLCLWTLMLLCDVYDMIIQ